MSLPKSVSAYPDEERILRLAVLHDGVRVPRTSLPPATSASLRARAERFRFRFFHFRRLLRDSNPSLAADAYLFDVKIDEFGDLSLIPKPRVETITTLDGRAINESPAPAEDIAAEAEALAAFLRGEDL